MNSPFRKINRIYVSSSSFINKDNIRRGGEGQVLCVVSAADNPEDATDLDRAGEGLLVPGPVGEHVPVEDHAVDGDPGVGGRQDHAGLGQHGGGIEERRDVSVGHVRHQNLQKENELFR